MAKVYLMEGRSMDDIFSSIRGKIRGMKGIVKTETSIAVE